MGGGNGMPNGSNCPLYIVTGASGVGKSALCREMAKIYGRVKKEKSGQPEEPEKLQKA